MSIFFHAKRTYADVVREPLLQHQDEEIDINFPPAQSTPLPRNPAALPKPTASYSGKQIYQWLKKNIQEGNGPEDIARIAADKKPDLLKFIRSMPFTEIAAIVEKALPALSENNAAIVELVRQNLPRLYLASLEHSGFYNRAESIEKHFDRIAEIFQTAHCNELERTARHLLSAPPASSAQLQNEMTLLRQTGSDLSEFLSRLTLVEPFEYSSSPMLDSYQYLFEHAYQGMNLYFPKCLQSGRRLLVQIQEADRYRTTFEQFFLQLTERLKRAAARANHSTQSTERQQFLVDYAVPMWRASLSILHLALQNSFKTKLDRWPEDLQKGWSEIRACYPNLGEELKAKNETALETTLFDIWDRISPTDLSDIMLTATLKMSNAEVHTLAVQLSSIQPENRYKHLASYGLLMLPRHPDLAALRKGCAK